MLGIEESRIRVVRTGVWNEWHEDRIPLVKKKAVGDLRKGVNIGARRNLDD